MRWLSITWVWAFLFLVHLSVHGTFGCLDEERSALLQIKSSINHPNGAALPLWDEKSDCCSWDEVKCNSTTWRVIELHLNFTRQYYDMGDWYLNASLLLPFQELQILDLSVNRLAGLVDGEAFKKGDSLGNLEIINLASNKINRSEKIVPYLEALTSLKSLDLGSNDMWLSNDDFRRLSKLTKLESIDLSESTFNQSMLPYLASLKSLTIQNTAFNGPLLIEELAALSKLEVLDLSKCYWNNSIPPSIESLTSLKALALSSNGLNDTQSIQGLCKLKNLQELDLSENEFDGTIPLCLHNLTNLQVLDLSDNRFSGTIPTSFGTSLTSMAYFFLGNNNFSGTFTLSSLSHLSNLKGIELECNDGLVVETEHPPWVPTFQLQYLSLPNCKINEPSSLIPSFLYHQYNLTHVDLSHNKLEGNFPVWLLENNTRLKILNLRNNSMTGTLHLPDYIILKDLLSLDISNNNLIGQIPIRIGALFPNLGALDVSRNALHGNIPYSAGNMSQLNFLDLSYNSLSGELPNHLAAGCIGLEVLILSNNRLSGQIPSTYLNFSNLIALVLNDNLFIGSISPSFFNGSLSILDVGNNMMSGELPSKIGNFKDLSGLNLRGNHFEGQIPLEFCKLRNLKFLDLSKNCLYGSIPSCFNLSFLKYMHLEKNEFSGVIPRSLSRSSSLVTLDIRHNKIVDFLPSWIGSLSNLRALLMKGNYLHGPIPSEVCKLKDLNILDLSYNNLSGSVPSCISKSTFGRGAIPNDAFNDVQVGGLGFTGDLLANTYLTRGGFGASFEVTGEQQEVEFMTKSRSDSYKGDILHYMSGIDLSSNELTGEIPLEFDQLIMLHALNLSNNQLSGSIPSRLSGLRQIESLDLSHNKLTGTIPHQLAELNFLSVFKVGYNNLVGPIPQTGQFNTFEQDSYEGNTLLCGLPVKRSCFSTTPNGIQNQQDGYGNKDISYFYGSFVGSYCVFLFATIVVLYYSKRFAIPCID